METAFIQLKDDINIAYRWVISEEQQTETIVVFLHEALGSIGQWKQFPQLLCNKIGAKGLIYERQGYGSSSPLTKSRNSNYLKEYAVEEMPQIINSLVKDQPIILVGHSDGGTIALLYAAAFPQNVQAVITMAAHVVVEEITLAGIQPAIEAYQAGKLKGLEKYHGNKTETLFYAWAHTWLSKEYRSWDICKEIKQTTPSLILQGDKDEYGTILQLDLIQNELENVTSYIIKDCSHQPHLEKKEEVSTLICEWLKTLTEVK